MTDEEMNVYKMRISQAGVAELTVIMLEMDMKWIDEAMVHYDNGEMDAYQEVLGKAQGVQTELMNVMNLDNEVAKDTYSIFAFINRQIIASRVKRVPVDLKRCRDMLGRLKESFTQIVSTDTAGPLMEQSEKVYAGLTYGSSGLVENSVGGTEYKV